LNIIQVNTVFKP